MNPKQEGTIGLSLRKLMDNNGFKGTKLIGYEHNWNNAGSYPTSLVSLNTFRGLVFV